VRSLRGKTAVITGAASGIGRALAERLARERMRLVLADIDARAVRDVSRRLPGSLAVRADVSRMADVHALAAKAYARFGAVHLLCNNAGVAEYGAVWEVPLRRWRRVVGANLWGAVHGCLAFVPRMIAQGESAHILNTASMAGLVTPPLAGPYSITKHAVVALSEALVQDLAMRKVKIGVSVLCPGWVATRLAESAPGADPVLRSLLARGLRPEAVADRAVRAIRAGEFYVLTHPEMAPAVQRRAEAILAGRAPAVPALRLPRSRAASR
jgi:NAD(P)-dependent dehydrogenase (short-subunit alcohol dehydrogenase family)